MTCAYQLLLAFVYLSCQSLAKTRDKYKISIFFHETNIFKNWREGTAFLADQKTNIDSEHEFFCQYKIESCLNKF